MAFDTTATAAVDRLHRMRGAAIAREYTCLAGVDRGYQTIWSGRPGVWIHGRVIDLGRRPDVGRAAPQTAGQARMDRRISVADVNAYFARHGYAPATVADVAADLDCMHHIAYEVLNESGQFVAVVRAAGNAANLYVPRGHEHDIRREDKLSPVHRAIFDVLQAHGEKMDAGQLAAAAGCHKSAIVRAAKRWPDIFQSEVWRGGGQGRGRGRALFVWIVGQKNGGAD